MIYLIYVYFLEKNSGQTAAAAGSYTHDRLVDSGLVRKKLFIRDNKKRIARK